VREIAKIYGCTEAAIRRMARTRGWTRDLTERAREQAKAQLAADPAYRATSEQAMVDNAAGIIVEVVQRHRGRIAYLNQIVDNLSIQLMAAATNRDELEATIKEETQHDRDNRRHNALMAAVSIGSHAEVALKLSNSVKNLITLERQAFNIDAEQKVGSTYEDQLLALAKPTA
jgi:hypothetical protein